MKKITASIILLAVLLISACTSTKQITRKAAYPDMYGQHLMTILVMPPINKTNNVDAKEFFFTTLSQPLCDKGYYVIPPYVSMEAFKNESAYDADLFLDRPLEKFKQYFGADIVLFTIIHRWQKAAFTGTITVEVEYIARSAKTNAIIYSRRGTLVLDTSMNLGGYGLLGSLANLAATAISTAATPHVKAAQACNTFTFTDFPAGQYSPLCENDSTLQAGQKIFRATVKVANVK